MIATELGEVCTPGRGPGKAVHTVLVYTVNVMKYCEYVEPGCVVTVGLSPTVIPSLGFTVRPVNPTPIL